MSEETRLQLPLQRNQFGGLITVIVFAGLSALSLLFVTCRCVFLAARSAFSGKTFPLSRESLFFRTQLGVYAVCLLTCNGISSISGMLEIVWALRGGIHEGPLCTVQGVLNQIANIGSAYFTAALALHTFNSFVLCWKNNATAIVAILFGWAATLGIALTPIAYKIRGENQYGISALSCGIKRQFALAQFLYHILPIFVGSVVSAIVSALFFLVLRGTLVFQGGVKLKLNPRERWNGRVGTLEEYQRFIAAIARSMLWFPFAYVSLLLPYSITRMADLNGFAVPFQVFILAYTCWFLLGTVNVALLYNTFRILQSALDAGKLSNRRAGAESFVSSEKTLARIEAITARRFPDGLAQNISPTGHRRKDSDHYLSVQAAQTRRLEHQRSDSNTGSAPSSARRLVPGQSASRDSLLSLESSVGGTIGCPITPVSQLNRSLSIPGPEPALFRDPMPRGHARTGSAASTSSLASNSSAGLPPAPRYSRSTITRRPTLESIPGDSAESKTSSSEARSTPTTTTILQLPDRSDSLLNLSWSFVTLGEVLSSSEPSFSSDQPARDGPTRYL